MNNQYQFSKYSPIPSFFFERTKLISVFDHKSFKNASLCYITTQWGSVELFIEPNTYI